MAGAGPTGPEVIELLGLVPHPEGGWYARTWVDPSPPGERPRGSAIYYLLQAGETAARHRVDATELWHHYAGAPVALEVAPPGAPAWEAVLGDDLAGGERPQLVVPAGAWQSARPLGGWALVGATVVPAFTFDGWELDAP